MRDSFNFKARMLPIVCALMIAALSAVTVMAQATTGTLRGTVVDKNGQAVAGAKVTVVSDNTGTSADYTTSSEGTFDAAALQPGSYTVTVEAAGFKRSVSKAVSVKIGIVNPFSTALEAGNISETVTVTSNSEEIVQRDQAQISHTVETRKVSDLPVSAAGGANGGLDVLALLAPGVVNQRSTGANTNGTGLSVNGNRGRSNNFQIDGADNNDLSVTGPALFVDFADQVQEYQVITNNFSAQYGRNQGAIVNIVTKGGTNQFHGTGFEFHQDAKNLNSLNNIEKRSGQLAPNQNLINVFGGTFGGPLPLPKFGESTGGGPFKSGKDKAFFFFGGQWVRNPATTTGSTTSLGIAPSELARLAATFPGSAAVQDYARYGPTAVTLRGPAVPNQFVSGTPVQALISTNFANGCAKAIGVTDTPAAGCTYTASNFLIRGPYDIINLGTNANPILFQGFQYQRTVSTPYTENYWNLRFDVKPTNKDQFTFRILDQVQDSINQLSCCSSGWNGDVPATSKHIGGDWTHTFGSTFVLTTRPNWQKIGVDFGGGCTNGVPGCIPGSADIATALANVTFSGQLGLTKTNALGGYGPATNLPQGRTGTVTQYPVDMTWAHGRHSIIFGFEYKHLNETVPFLPNFNGAFAFAAFTTGADPQRAARFVNNAPSAVSITLGDPTLPFHENDEYAYFQDDFKFRPNLTLNLGVRYEYTGQPINILNKITMAREANATTAFFNPALPLAQRVVPAIPADKNNFAPRLGFAWSPHFWKHFLGEDATVVRGGFSIAYDAAFYNILLNVQNAAPFSAALTIPVGSLSSTTTSPNPLPLNPTGDVVRAAAAANGVLPKGQLNPIFLTQTTVAPNFRSPYAEQWSLGVQHQFGKRQVGEVRYVGTHGVALFTSTNGNFFVGPMYNGLGTINVCTARTGAGCTATTPVTFGNFRQFLPAGVVAQVCTDIAGTPDNEGACNNRVLPQGSLTVRTNQSQSIYHSMQARYNGRFFNNTLNFGAGYTFSKAIDDESDIFARTDIATPNAQNPFCVNRCERGLSATDRPHAFSMNFIYDVPFMREQKGLLGHLLGGWQVNGTYFLTSGAAFTPSESTALNNLGNSYLSNGDRPFLANPAADRRQVGISQVDAFYLGFVNIVSDINGFYSLNAINQGLGPVPVTLSQVKYVLNGPGAARIFGTPFGSAGRNIERGPKFNQLNASLFKNVKVGERLTVQVRGEAFNVLNHPTPGVGNTVGGGYLPDILVSDAGLNGSSFGNNQDITFARRVVQVGIRLIF